MTRVTLFVGVDISKAQLDIARWPEGRFVMLNDETGIAHVVERYCRTRWVAPLNRDSGRSEANAPCGVAALMSRPCLYMAALVASRCNPVIRSFYQRLCETGKAKKVTLTA